MSEHNSLTKMNSYLQELKDEFGFYSSKRELLEALMEYGKCLEELSLEFRTDEYKVPGCISGVFITAELKDGKVFYKGFSESFIVKGFVYILFKALSGLTPKDIINAEQTLKSFSKDTSLSASEITSRANSFGNIYDFMKKKALFLK